MIVLRQARNETPEEHRLEGDNPAFRFFNRKERKV